MQNQDRVEQEPKAKGGGLCREIKVVSVREELPACSVRFAFSPAEISSFWRTVIAKSVWYHEEKEHFVCFCLDTKFNLKSFSLVSIGTLNESLAHAREVFRPAIADSAFAIIIAHNHPSGDASPSKADVELTRRLHAAGEILQISLLDHLIVTDRNYCSLRESFSQWPLRSRPGPCTIFSHRETARTLKLPKRTRRNSMLRNSRSDCDRIRLRPEERRDGTVENYTMNESHPDVKMGGD